MEGPLEGPLENGGDMCSKEEEPMLIKPEDKEKVETPPPPVIIKFSDDEEQNLIKIKDTCVLKRKVLAEQLPLGRTAQDS